MCAYLIGMRCGWSRLCISFLFTLLVFSSVAFSQTVEPAFKPLLPDSGTPGISPRCSSKLLQTLSPCIAAELGTFRRVATVSEAIQFGISTGKPVVGDYDGDGKADLVVFRDGIWYLQQSTSGFAGVQFGAASYVPVESAFVP